MQLIFFLRLYSVFHMSFRKGLLELFTSLCGSHSQCAVLPSTTGITVKIRLSNMLGLFTQTFLTNGMLFKDNSNQTSQEIGKLGKKAAGSHRGIFSGQDPLRALKSFSCGRLERCHWLRSRRSLREWTDDQYREGAYVNSKSIGFQIHTDTQGLKLLC